MTRLEKMQNSNEASASVVHLEKGEITGPALVIESLPPLPSSPLHCVCGGCFGSGRGSVTILGGGLKDV